MIYINGRFLAQNITGVQRFARELTVRLLKNSNDFVLLVPSGITLEQKFRTENVIQSGPSAPYLWEQFFLPTYLRKKDNPLLLNFTGLGPIFYKNKIITIHDLSFWEHPEWFSKKYYWFYRLFTPISALHSSKILTVSASSKESILKNLKKKEEEVEVIYNAINPNANNVKLKSKFILAVGSIDPRKNLGRLIRAFLRWNNTDYQLFLIGGKQNSFSKQNYPISNRIKYLGYISDQELFDYYRKAEIFIYPSLYEGFGIPPLEAMSFGTPAIVSEIPSLKESCGSAAFYIDPYSEESIITALDALSKDESLRNELRQKGFENIKRFSWEESVQKVIQIVIESEK